MDDTAIAPESPASPGKETARTAEVVEAAGIPDEAATTPVRRKSMKLVLEDGTEMEGSAFGETEASLR